MPVHTENFLESVDVPLSPFCQTVGTVIHFCFVQYSLFITYFDKHASRPDLFHHTSNDYSFYEEPTLKQGMM